MDGRNLTRALEADLADQIECAGVIAGCFEHFENSDCRYRSDRLPRPERVRGEARSRHPAGHFVVRSGPLNGVKTPLVVKTISHSNFP